MELFQDSLGQEVLQSFYKLAKDLDVIFGDQPSKSNHFRKR